MVNWCMMIGELLMIMIIVVLLLKDTGQNYKRSLLEKVLVEI